MLRDMDPITITVGLLGLWGLYKLVQSKTPPPYPIVIPPSGPWPTVTPAGALCPPNLAPPPGVVPITAPFPADLSPWGYRQLKYPKGTTVIDMVDGQLIVGRLEWHYHPPGMQGVTATGCHKGLTAYRPKGDMPWVQIAGDNTPNT
jgi:hypothetical protein